MADLSAFPITRRWPASHPDRIQLYSLPTPNGVKVSIALEELELPYEPHLIDIGKNETWGPEFLSLNPNGKIPAIIDPNGPGGKPFGLWESGAILLYLAEKTGQFLPQDTPKARGEMLSWLMFVATGIGPYCGQAVHFSRFAPEKLPYAINRYAREAERHWGIVNDLLAKRRYMLGERYTLVDMSIWGWATRLSFAIGETWPEMLPHVKRHLDEISARPAAQRAVALKDRFAFKADFDAEARKFLFPQNAHLAG